MVPMNTREAAALTGLHESAIRKDVELGVVEAGSPPSFAEPTLIYFHTRSLCPFELGVEDRRRLYRGVAQALEAQARQYLLGRGWTVDIEEIATDLRSRVARFEIWKAHLVVSETILGGEPVFPNSRLAVRQIGEMLRRGASPAELLEDYPYLTAEDLEFAPVFSLAYPRMGRPRAQAAA